jgi:tRNA A37 threonylcarbamoyladenosine synthetase subunit TsaC/SUA5/YrdC
MPMDPVALELLRSTGPMAVSSANLTGRAPALDAIEARAQLGDLVEVYLDGGPAAGLLPSTIVDVTGARPRLLRPGAISLAELRTVAPDLELVP